MKKFVIVFITTFGFFSCTEDFITRDPIGVSSTASYYNDPDQCQLAVNAIYDPLGWFELHDEYLWKIGDICSDDAEKGGGNNKEQYYADGLGSISPLAVFEASDRSEMMAGIWNASYVAIGRANAMLSATEGLVSGENGEKYKVMRGEVRFLRAWYYFQLTKVFGPVILAKQTVSVAEAANLGNRTSGDDNIGSKQVRAQYDFIIDELEAIKDDLPKTASAVGKVTNGAARAFLAKAYLYRADMCKNPSDYENAYQTAYSLYKEGNYALEEHYQDVFDIFGYSHENSKEVVFSVQHVDGSLYGTKSEGSIHPKYVAPRFLWDETTKENKMDDKVGYGFAMPTQKLLDAFEAGDARATMIVAAPHGNSEINATITKLNLDTAVWCRSEQLTNTAERWCVVGKSDWSTGYFNMKKSYLLTAMLDSPQDGQSMGKDEILIRWADVMLIAAEAGVQSGHTTEATSLINELRKRARNSARTIDYTVAGSSAACYTYTPAATPADIASADLEAVKRERRVEMYGEGERYWDLIRWDDVANFRTVDISGHAVQYNSETLGRWPIPQSEIILHSGGNLKQNPGY